MTCLWRGAEDASPLVSATIAEATRESRVRRRGSRLTSAFPPMKTAPLRSKLVSEQWMVPTPRFREVCPELRHLCGQARSFFRRCASVFLAPNSHQRCADRCPTLKYNELWPIYWSYFERRELMRGHSGNN